MFVFGNIEISPVIVPNYLQDNKLLNIYMNSEYKMQYQNCWLLKTNNYGSTWKFQCFPWISEDIFVVIQTERVWQTLDQI